MLSVFGTDIIWTENVEKKIFNKTNIEYYNPYSDKILIKDKIIYNTNKLLKIRDAELLNEKYKDDNFYLTLCDKLTDLTDKTIANIK
jgi:hypothetical protein